MSRHKEYPLTGKQQEAVDMARAFIAENDHAPTYRELGAWIGITLGAAHGRMREAFGRRYLRDLRDVMGHNKPLPKPGGRRSQPRAEVVQARCHTVEMNGTGPLHELGHEVQILAANMLFDSGEFEMACKLYRGALRQPQAQGGAK